MSKVKRNSLGQSGLAGPEILSLANYCFTTFHPMHREVDKQHKRRLCREIMMMADKGDKGIVTFDEFKYW